METEDSGEARRRHTDTQTHKHTNTHKRRHNKTHYAPLVAADDEHVQRGIRVPRQCLHNSLDIAVVMTEHELNRVRPSLAITFDDSSIDQRTPVSMQAYCRPVATSQMRTVLSSEPDASHCFPSVSQGQPNITVQVYTNRTDNESREAPSVGTGQLHYLPTGVCADASNAAGVTQVLSNATHNDHPVLFTLHTSLLTFTGSPTTATGRQRHNVLRRLLKTARNKPPENDGRRNTAERRTRSTAKPT